MTIVTDDGVTGCKSAIIFEGDELIVQGSQDVTEIEEYNKAHLNHHDHNARCAKDGEHVGRIPLTIMYQLIKEGIWYDDEALLQWLEQPENKVWKVHPGRFA